MKYSIGGTIPWSHPIMIWSYDIACFFGGLFLSNAVPHYVSGMQGRPFQSPFASPPGEGLSSSTVNVVWGFANMVIAWLLLTRVGGFDPDAWDNVASLGAGLLAMGLFAARHFGRFHGGGTD
jgi:hypothetical protein